MKKDTRENIIALSGSFDPPTLEELFFMDAAKSSCDWLVIGLHSDEWIERNRGGVITEFETRKRLLLQHSVDEVFQFNDDNDTTEQFKKLVKICYPGAVVKFFHDKMSTKK